VVVRGNTAKTSGTIKESDNNIDQISISMRYTFYQEHKKTFDDKYKAIKAMIVCNDPSENTRVFKHTQDLHTSAN
jgi:hypothetical protein